MGASTSKSAMGETKTATAKRLAQAKVNKAALKVRSTASKFGVPQRQMANKWVEGVLAGETVGDPVVGVVLGAPVVGVALGAAVVGAADGSGSGEIVRSSNWQM